MALGLAYVAMLLGPSVASILLTGLVDGRAGLREMLTRMTRWRVAARWYTVALKVDSSEIVVREEVEATEEGEHRCPTHLSSGLIRRFSPR